MKSTRQQRNWISRMRLAVNSALPAMVTLLVMSIITSGSGQAQTFTTLHSFNGTEGSFPLAGLVQATDGNFYGTAGFGGANGVDGTVFRITPGGKLKALYSFCSESGCTDGAGPTAGVVQAADGAFYGITNVGGANGDGTVFKITSGGKLTTLYSFCSKSSCADGSNPWAGLIQATDGDLYGTTSLGGANGNYGTVFKITSGGALTTLYSFCSKSGCADGSSPQGQLMQATDGSFYGTTFAGGSGAYGAGGTIFKITPTGTLTTLYSFCSRKNCSDGYNPNTQLVQTTDGNFYGTTLGGGKNGDYGTVFKITSGGTLTTLHRFCSQASCADGYNPSQLVQATDGNFYAAASTGGANGQGTIFKMTPTGTLTTLYSFCAQGCTTAGYYPTAGLAQSTNGAFYGTTYEGGTDGAGTVYSLSVGLGPFIEAQPTSGKVGAAVKILGTNLTGATSVTFNGTAATFKVKSSSEITTKVPTGATTGTVQVVTPGGTLSSNVPFQVP
jgi:uncharacterized repeat protein (TIGR03803 family)